MSMAQVSVVVSRFMSPGRRRAAPEETSSPTEAKVAKRRIATEKAEVNVGGEGGGVWRVALGIKAARCVGAWTTEPRKGPAKGGSVPQRAWLRAFMARLIVSRQMVAPKTSYEKALVSLGASPPR